MMGGDWVSDMATNGAIRSVKQWEAAFHDVNRELGEMCQAHAGNLGVRYALEVQLKHSDPDNPLLKDTSLIERIKKAAESGFLMAKRHFDGARDAGRTFVIPGREKARVRLQPPELLKNEPAPTAAELEHFKMAYAGAIAVRNACQEQLRRFDPTNPILTDASLFERIKKAGQASYKLADDNFDAARDAGNSFNIPGRN